MTTAQTERPSEKAMRMARDDEDQWVRQTGLALFDGGKVKKAPSSRALRLLAETLLRSRPQAGR